MDSTPNITKRCPSCNEKIKDGYEHNQLLFCSYDCVLEMEACKDHPLEERNEYEDWLEKSFWNYFLCDVNL